MAVVEVAVGNVIVNVLAAVCTFGPPKSNIATAAFVVLVDIKAPDAVKAAGFQVTFANDINAVLLEVSEVGRWDTVKILPPAVYPVPVISPSVV